MAIKIKENYHTIVTVKRPNGEIEIVKNPNTSIAKYKDYQAEVIKQTKAAGRGDILKFELGYEERDATWRDMHPMLLAAEIEDYCFCSSFEQSGRVEVPGLTYQYKSEGEFVNKFDTSRYVNTIALFEKSPEIFKIKFFDEKSPNRDQATEWEKLVNLVKGFLSENPVNEENLSDAWLLGIIPQDQIPEHLLNKIFELKTKISEFKNEKNEEQEIIELAKSSGVKQKIGKSWMTDGCKCGNECSFDYAQRYALPQGGFKVEYQCCY